MMKYLLSVIIIAAVALFIATWMGLTQHRLKPLQRWKTIQAISGLIELKEPPEDTPIDVMEALRIENGGVIHLIWLDAREPAQRSVSYIPRSRPILGFSPDTIDSKTMLAIIFDTIGWESVGIAKELNHRKFWRGVVRSLRGGMLAWAYTGRDFDSPSGPTKKLQVGTGFWNLVPEGYVGVW